MFGFLPKPRSPLWFAAGAGLCVLASLVYLTFFTLVFKRNPDSLNIPGILLIFFIITQLSALGGYFNMPLFLSLSVLGFVIGLGVFLAMLANPGGGFEDLAGALSFLILTAAGFLAGAVAEVFRFGLNYYKKKK